MRRVLALTAAAALVLVLAAPAAVARGRGNSFTAHLGGGNEVPSVDTHATGQALFKLHQGELRYKLIVANIDEVQAAHIHCGTADQNGPVTVTLFAGGPTSASGILAEGTIADEDVADNGCGPTVDDLLVAMAAGETYVNVHTIAHPSGEIRGQID